MFWLCWLLIGGLALDNFLQWRKIGNLRKEIDMLHDSNRGAWSAIRDMDRKIVRIEFPLVANNDR